MSNYNCDILKVTACCRVEKHIRGLQKGKCSCVPVYNIIGLFCADDTEGVNSSIGGSKMCVLSWSSSKTPSWALTASQELTHTAETWSGVSEQMFLSCTIRDHVCYWTHSTCLMCEFTSVKTTTRLLFTSPRESNKCTVPWTNRFP